MIMRAQNVTRGRKKATEFGPLSFSCRVLDNEGYEGPKATNEGRLEEETWVSISRATRKRVRVSRMRSVRRNFSVLPEEKGAE